MRRKQREVERGSQYWIQYLVNENPTLLNHHIGCSIKCLDPDQIKWLSPRKDDAYAEYCDAEFINLLAIKPLRIPLERFWPQGGPCWDALGKAGADKIILVEAKSHIAELASNPCQARSLASIELINASLSKTKVFFDAHEYVDWTKCFYQYANRLAHLRFLREDNNINAFLIFIYFINDSKMEGPTCKPQWQGAIDLLHSFLGLKIKKLSPFVADVFIDVANL